MSRTEAQPSAAVSNSASVPGSPTATGSLGGWVEVQNDGGLTLVFNPVKVVLDKVQPVAPAGAWMPLPKLPLVNVLFDTKRLELGYI